MLNYRFLILDKITWKIGNGNQDRFLFDSWGGYLVISKMENFEVSKQILENEFGSLVINYVDLGVDYPKVWRWKSFDNLNLPPKELFSLHKILVDRSISFFH